MQNLSITYLFYGGYNEAMINQLLNAKTYKDFAIYECGDEECVKNKAIVLTQKDYHLLHYVVSGKGTLVLNKKEYHLEKGMIFFIPRRTDAIYFPEKDDPWHYRWIGFDGEKADELLGDIDVDINHPIILDKNRKYLKYFNDIIFYFNERGYLDLHALGTAYELFGDLLLAKEEKSGISSVKATVELAKQFINNNYQFDININDIAKNAKVAPNYLSTIFNREEGMTTKKYLTKVRMEKARELLTSGHFKIKEIAEWVGYPNQLHFSAQFKKYYGKSPLIYASEDLADKQ